MAREAAEPRAGRPRSPGAYWGTAHPRPLPWSWAEARLVQASTYWIASVLPDGRPHARPVWGIWRDGRFSFDTGSRIGSNLLANPEVTVHLDSGQEVVIVEGAAERVTEHTEVQAFLDVYNAKYFEDLSTPPGLVFLVRPRIAFGWICPPTALDTGTFAATGTRWDFAPIHGGGA